MIEKNIRLQPHHSRDLLVGRRSDGKRPKYQPPSQGGGFANTGGGGGGGGGEYADRHPPVYVAPVTTAVAPPSILAKEPPKDTRGDTPDRIAEQIILDKIQKKEKEKFERAQDYMDLKAKEPTIVKPSVPYDRQVIWTGSPHGEHETGLRPTIVSNKYSPTYYQDKSKIGGETYGERAEAGIKRGMGLGTLAKGAAAALAWPLASAFVPPKLMTGLTWGKRAHDFSKGKGTAAWLAKKAGLDPTKLTSNLRSTIEKAKAAKFRDERTTLGKEDIEAWERKQDWSGVKPSREGGDGIPTAITGDKGLLTEGAKTLGITNEQREQYMLMQNKMKMALDQGSYTNEQGQTIQLNEQQLNQLQNYIDKLDSILGTVLQTAAQGGRIDSPLMGGIRYI